MRKLQGKIKQQDIDMGEEDEIEISLLLCPCSVVYIEWVHHANHLYNADRDKYQNPTANLDTKTNAYSNPIANTDIYTYHR